VSNNLLNINSFNRNRCLYEGVPLICPFFQQRILFIYNFFFQIWKNLLVPIWYLFFPLTLSFLYYVSIFISFFHRITHFADFIWWGACFFSSASNIYCRMENNYGLNRHGLRTWISIEVESIQCFNCSMIIYIAQQNRRKNFF
jgi:hypothetical protein